MDIVPEEAKKQDESSRADTKRNGVKYAVSFCGMGNMEHDAAAFLYGVRSIGVFENCFQAPQYQYSSINFCRASASFPT